MTWSKSDADEKFDKKISRLQLFCVGCVSVMLFLGLDTQAVIMTIFTLITALLEIRRDLMNCESELKEINFRLKLMELNKDPYRIPNFFDYNKEIPK